MSITTVTPLDENGDLGEKDETIVENKVVSILTYALQGYVSTK